jgi:hypothetical protein
VFIAAAYEFDVTLLRPLVAHIYVCRQVATGQVTNVHGAVGIRQCGRYEDALEFIFHLNRLVGDEIRAGFRCKGTSIRHPLKNQPYTIEGKTGRYQEKSKG